MVFLIISLTMNSLKLPFANHRLNNLESLSLLSSALTVYCGLYYLADASFVDEEACKNTIYHNFISQNDRIFKIVSFLFDYDLDFSSMLENY